MDFQEQIRLHGQLRDTLLNAVAEERTLEIATLKSDRQCETGCWLHGDGGRRWAGNHAFLGLLETHRAFHNAVGAIADQINRKQYSDAQRALRTGTPFALALADLNAAFRRMKTASENLVT